MDRQALTPAPTPAEVVAVARRAVSAMSAAAWRKARVQVVLAAAEVEMWAIADEQRLYQKLVSLLHAAVGHATPGGVVTVSLETQPEAVVIRVQDTGTGRGRSITLRRANPA